MEVRVRAARGVGAKKVCKEAPRLEASQLGRSYLGPLALAAR